MWCGQDNFNVHSTLFRIDKRLLDSAIIHLFRLDQQRMMSTINQSVKVVARIDGADDKVGIVELRRCMVPVSIEDSDYRLHIICVSIDDIVFTVAQVTAAAVSAESRACEVRSHDIGGIVVDNHTNLAKCII